MVDRGVKEVGLSSCKEARRMGSGLGCLEEACVSFRYQAHVFSSRVSTRLKIVRAARKSRRVGMTA